MFDVICNLIQAILERSPLHSFKQLQTNCNAFSSSSQVPLNNIIHLQRIKVVQEHIHDNKNLN